MRDAGASSPPTSLCGTSAQCVLALDQVAADLEVLHPRELGLVGVGGQAGESGLERRALRRRVDPDPAVGLVGLDGHAHREREAVGRDERQDGGPVVGAELA